MQKKTSVLIVGAGPTGLMMACQLIILKIPFILVEKDSGPTTQSRALGIQARTLEIFAQMGIIEKFLKRGYPAKGANYVSRGKIIRHVPFSGMGQGLTAFPFMLMLEQSKTENILIDFIAQYQKTILWNNEVISFTQDTKGIVAQVKDKNGKESSMLADYIIGADGAHSIVRHTLGILLAGKTYKQSLFVLDCEIQWKLPHDALSVVFSDTSFAAFFPMSNNRWRIVGEVPKTALDKNELTFGDIEPNFAQQMQMDIKLTKPAWISLYHSHHRHVANFRQGRAFLLGDAAHIHSPVGAQGMNTGLQDAYNLAWKLAFVIQKKSSDSLLDTYNEERLPFAKKLVETTDRVFNLTISHSAFAKMIRMYIVPVVLSVVIHSKKFRNFAFKTVSQIGIEYRQSSISHHASQGQFPKHAPEPGDRLPYFLYRDEKEKELNLQTDIPPTHFQLLVFPGKKESLSIVQVIRKYSDLIKITTIPLHNGTQKLYKQLGITEQGGYYLVRPDMYIAYRNTLDETKKITAYLERFFISSL